MFKHANYNVAMYHVCMELIINCPMHDIIFFIDYKY